MADEPTSADFLNHIRATLDADLQRWRFCDPAFFSRLHNWRSITVRFLGTGDEATICQQVITGQWRVQSLCPELEVRLLGRLLGKKRNDAGVLQ